MASKCLICREVTSLTTIGNINFCWNEYKTCTKLPEELAVILLLRNVLGISKTCLLSLLQGHGNPTSWGVKLCPPCNRVFTEVEFIHGRIRKLQAEFVEIAKNLRKNVRVSKQLTTTGKGRKRTQIGSSDAIEAILDDFVRVEAKTSSTETPVVEIPILRAEKSPAAVKVEAPDIDEEYSHRKNDQADDIRDTLLEQQQINLPDAAPATEALVDADVDLHSDVGQSQSDEDGDDFCPNSDDQDELDSDSNTEMEATQVDGVAVETSKSKFDPFSVPQPIKCKKGYKCPTCGRTALSKSSAHGHILRAHYGESKPFPCHLCRAKFRREVRLRQHLDDKHDSASSPLDDPDEVKEISPSSVSETAPLENNQDKKRFQCEICPKTKYKVLYKSQETLDAHKKRVHLGIKRPYNCKLCDKAFRTENVLRHHLYVHRRQEKEKQVQSKQPRPFCVECNRSFKRLDALKHHMRTKRHLQPHQYPFQCEHCPKIYYYKNSFDNHLAQEHYEALNIKPFKCSFCGSILSSERALDHHIRIRHTKDTRYRCEPCDVGFMYAHSLKHHMNVVHAKEKTLLCAYCPKKFSTKNQLNTHTRTHTGEKPYKCPHCGKQYSDKPTYNRHLETHGQKVYKCSFCDDREFKVWHSYRLHMKTHNQEIYKNPLAKSSNDTATSTTSTVAETVEDEDAAIVVPTETMMDSDPKL